MKNKNKNKIDKYKDAVPEVMSFEEKNESKDPPGVFMPPESEMSPAQLG